MLTERNWTDDLDIVLQAGSQDAQAQDYMFQIKRNLVRAGWVVAMSQTAAVVSSAADVWTAYTDVTVGAEGAGGGAWAVLTPPASFRGSSTVQILLSMNDATTPRNVISIRVLRNGSYSLPGVANTLPVASGGSNVTVHGGSLVTTYAAATAIDARLAVLFTDKGDCFIFFRGAGDAGARQMFAVYSNTDAAGGGFGGHRYVVVACGSLTANIVLWTSFSNTNWLAFTGDGITALGAGAVQSIAASLTNWASGTEAVGGWPACPIELAANSASVNQNRDLGPLVDVFGVPAGFAGVTNAVQDGDTDVSELRQLKTLGVLAFPILRANSFP